MIVYRARTKAGRAWIETILASAIRVDALERDLITDACSRRTIWRDITNGREPIPAFLRAMFSDRYVELYDPLNGGGSTYFMITTSARSATRYEITVYPFDPSDLPDVPQEDA